MPSPQRRAEILDALRRGTVPRRGLEHFAVGMERFQPALDEELTKVAAGAGVFKAIRGDYGCGKTFLARWLQDRAQRQGFATAEVQISETETPLHKLETVYRRLMERLSTSDCEQGAARSLIDSWFYVLEEDVLAEGKVSASDSKELLARTNDLLESRLTGISRTAPAFSIALRGYRQAVATDQSAIADGLLAWLCGQPNVGAEAKRAAGIKGEVDHFAALGFLQGLLAVLRDSGRPGLLIVLDEVETLQRVRGDVREKALNALRQLIDEVDASRFPGLYLLITGTPSFFDSPQGVQRLPPLSQRLHVDFSGNYRFDNPRAVQLRLKPFDFEALVSVGLKVCNIFADGASNPQRILSVVNADLIQRVAKAVSGKLGGKVGVAPRVFLKKLVGDLLDRIDQFPDFDPERDFSLNLAQFELTEIERSAQAGISLDDIDLKL